jgi:hypothetical protein
MLVVDMHRACGIGWAKCMLFTSSGCFAGIDILVLLLGLRGRLHVRSMRCRTHGVRSVVHSATCRWRPPCSGGWVGFWFICQCYHSFSATGGLICHDSRPATMLHWHHGDRRQEYCTAGVGWHRHIVEVQLMLPGGRWSEQNFAVVAGLDGSPPLDPAAAALRVLHSGRAAAASFCASLQVCTSRSPLTQKSFGCVASAK